MDDSLITDRSMKSGKRRGNGLVAPSPPPPFAPSVSQKRVLP